MSHTQESRTKVSTVFLLYLGKYIRKARFEFRHLGLLRVLHWNVLEAILCVAFLDSGANKFSLCVTGLSFCRLCLEVLTVHCCVRQIWAQEGSPLMNREGGRPTGI